MGLFSKKNTNAAPVSERQLLQAKYAGSRSNLILVMVFTVINIVLLVTNSNSYFLFSAYIPYMFADMGMYLCGRYPVEFYEADAPITDYEFYPDSFFVFMLTIAAVILLVYLACWIFSRKEKYGWLVAALVLFGIDTAGLIYFLGMSVDNIIDLVFHAWVIISLISGISAALKLKKLPEEEIPAEEAVPTVDGVPVDMGNVDGEE